jgi:hypothetical protein
VRCDFRVIINSRDRQPFTLLTGRNLPKIRQAPEPERSIIYEKAVADFTPVVEQTGILKCDHLARAGRKAFFNF